MEKTETELNYEMEDSPMTIEYLRARLLSERSVSKSAKQRADELAERVMELEEKLNVVYLQRKKTEKATSAVLAILGSLAISDEPEGCDLSSDQELKNPQCCDGNCLEKNTDKSRRMDRPGCEPTMLSCRSLSWKSSRCSSQRERKFISTPSRRRSGVPSVDFSSPKHHLGKSCRQMERRDARSTTDESSENEVKSEHQREDGDSKIFTCNPDSQDEKLSAGDTASICITSPRKLINYEHHIHEHEGDQKMEKALEHRAELIYRHEAEENAQIEWEEKYREHNSSTPESVEPGSQSDVTEERDELRRQPASDLNVNEDVKSQVKDARINEVCRSLSNKDDVQRQPFTQTTVGPQKNDTSQPEDAVPMNKTKQTRNKPERCSSSLSETAATNAIYCEGETSKTAIRKSVCVSQEASKDLGSVLEALQQAKLSLQHKLRKLPLSEDGFKVKAVESHYFPDRAQMPASCAALFWVPTDLQSEENVHKSHHASRPHSTLMDGKHDSTSAMSSNKQIKLKPRERVTISNASDGSSFDFTPNWKSGDDYTQSPVLSEKGFSNSDRYKLSPQFGTPRSSFTGSDGNAQSPLPDFNFGFLANNFDASSYPLATSRSSISVSDLHPQGSRGSRSSPSSSDRQEFKLQPGATRSSLNTNGQFARNPYSSSSPSQLRNTRSGSLQPFSPEPYNNNGPVSCLSSNDRHFYKPSDPSILDFKPAMPTFQGFTFFTSSPAFARDPPSRKLG